MYWQPLLLQIKVNELVHLASSGVLLMPAPSCGILLIFLLYYFLTGFEMIKLVEVVGEFVDFFVEVLGAIIILPLTLFLLLTS